MKLKKDAHHELVKDLRQNVIKQWNDRQYEEKEKVKNDRLIPDIAGTDGYP